MGGSKKTARRSGQSCLGQPAYIKLGPVHIILVPKGKIVPLLVNGEGHFLLEGRHMINQVRPSARTPSIPPSVEPSSLPTLCC